MKRFASKTVILSLIFFTLVSCGISVPFMWDGTKIDIRTTGQGHTFRVKDSQYTIDNGYHISVMYLYVLTDRDTTSSYSYWQSFEKSAKRDSHNSKTFRFSETSINPMNEKDTTEYPVFMLDPIEGTSCDNGAPNYLLNQANAGFVPEKDVKVRYEWSDPSFGEKPGYIRMTVESEGKEPFSVMLARSNGKDFRKNSFSQGDSEFAGEKNPVKFDVSGDYIVWVMPVVYAYSDNHPNQKFHFSTSNAVKLDMTDIKLEASRPETGLPEAEETVPAPAAPEPGNDL